MSVTSKRKLADPEQFPYPADVANLSLSGAVKKRRNDESLVVVQRSGIDLSFKLTGSKCSDDESTQSPMPMSPVAKPAEMEPKSSDETSQEVEDDDVVDRDAETDYELEDGDGAAAN